MRMESIMISLLFQLIVVYSEIPVCSNIEVEAHL